MGSEVISPSEVPESGGKETGTAVVAYEVGRGKPPVHTRFGQPGANRSGNGKLTGASLKAAVARRLAKHPNADGTGEGADAIAEEVVRRLTSKKGFDPGLYRTVSEQVDGKPSQSVQHSGTIHLVPMILEGAPADMLEEGAGDGEDADG